MTLLDDPPVASESPVARPAASISRPSAWRFAARLARRETIRRPGRTVLAALLIAVPVMAMTIGSVLIRSDSGGWGAQFDRRFGDADIAIDRSRFAFSSGDESAPPALPAGTTVTDYLWISTAIDTGDPGLATTFGTVTDIDLTNADAASPIEVIGGRAPRSGEIMLPSSLVKELGLSIGDQVTFERPSGTWTLSGVGRMRDAYYEQPIVIPGFDRGRLAPEYDQNVVVIYDLPDGTSMADTQQLAGDLGGVSRYDDPYFVAGSSRPMAWGLVAGVLALVAVGIIVAAAFATSARRQLVTIGQLTSNGATAPLVRRTLALQGTWTGLMGAVVGLAAGFAALPFAKPIIERHILQHDAGALRADVADMLVIALTATIAGTVAAAVPARSAARIPVMSALAGRRPLGSLPRWFVPTGLLLLAGGLGFIAIASLGINGSSSGNSDDVWALLIVLGVVGVVFGMCCATPLVIERIGALGRFTSLSWRLSLRSLRRSRTRSSAVVAAIAVAVGGSVAAGAIIESLIRENAANWTESLPADTIVFDAFHNDEATFAAAETGSVLDYDALPSAPLPDDLRAAVLAIVPDASIVPMRVATLDPAPFNTETGDGGVYPEPHGPEIGDPALLDILGLSDRDIETLEAEGALRPVGRWEFEQDNASDPGYEGPIWQYQGPDGLIGVDPPAATSPFSYDYTNSVPYLMTESAARQLGFDIVERGAIVRAPSALTVAQRDALVQLQRDLMEGQIIDAFIEPGDPPRTALTDGPADGEVWNVTYDEPRYRAVDDSDLWVARLVVLSAVVLISLLVVSIGLSLAAAEGREERDVLAVVGATPATMRRQASARAAVLAVSGIVIGIPTGFLPAWVLYSVLNSDGRVSTEPLRFPWLVTAGLVVIIPVLVAGVAWMGAGIGQRFRPDTPTRRD